MQKVFMKWIRSAAVLFAVALIGASTGLAQVTVELSQLVGRPGESGFMAVNISGVEGGAAIQSFGFDVVTDGNVEFTGISLDDALAGDAGFNVDTNVALSRVGGFAQGTDIETSGTLIYLNFDLVSSGAGNVSLANFMFNAGDPAIVGGGGEYVVSDRMLNVGDEQVHENDEFTVKVIVEDAFLRLDEVVSFSMDVNYNPDHFTVDKNRGANGVITSNTLTSASVVNGNDIGGENSGVYRVAGFLAAAGVIEGSGVFFELAALAGEVPGLEGPGTDQVFLTNVMFNNGTPLYGAFPGNVEVLPFNVANEDEPETPSEFVLDGNYPNPFNPTTNIQFDLPEAANVSVQVMDLLGREVMAIPSQSFTAGSNQTIQVTAGNLTSGLYLYRVIAYGQTKTSVKTGTMTLFK